MEYRELKNSLCLIDNVGFSRSSNKDFTFSCFIQKCNFYTTILLELMGHLESDHKNEKWFGFCYACNSQIYHRKVNLLKELEHMTQEGYHKIGKAEIAFICLESESKQKKMKEAVNAVRANRLSCDFDNGKSIVSLKPWTRHTMKTQMHCKKMLSKRCLYALYKCMDTNCSFSTMYAKKMLAHLEGHERRPSHGTPSWLECAYCDTISDSSSTLLEHIRNEHGSSLYQCKYCFYRSSFAYYVVVHLDQFHEFSIKKVLVCNGKEKRLENEKESIQENRAKNHLLNHRIGVYQCLHCIYGANNIRTIRRHMCNTHPTKSPYVCVRLERKYQIFNDEELESVESTMILQLDNSIDQKLFERCPLSDGQLDNLCDANIANNSSNPLPDPLQETGDFLESTSSDAPVENDKTACNLVQSIGQEEINKFCLLLTKGSREFEQTNCFNNQYLNGNDSLYLQTESDILMTENIPIQKENCENSYTIHNNDDAGQGDITIKQKSIPPPVKLTRESYNLQMKTTPVKRKVEPLKENQSKQVKKRKIGYSQALGGKTQAPRQVFVRIGKNFPMFLLPVHHNKDTITISLENYLSDPLLDRICTEDNEISPPQHDEIQWVCPECGKTSHNQLDLVAHIRQHFLQFQCSFCEEKLDSFLLIKKHNEIVHKKDNQIYRNVDINENLEQYLNMKMIFPNGLMLTKKQSKNTRFGGMKDVIKMIENLNNEDLEAVRQEENQEGFIHAVLQPNML
ncbi:hypothetical protein Bhyg_13673, partial [Pseudolycoriella hygida]